MYCAVHTCLNVLCTLFVAHTFVKGIPRPLPINRKLNRDSFICEDDDVIRDSVSVSNSKNIEDTEEFKKAVESFDEIFQSESGNASPEANTRRLSKKLETSPNVNWKRIKTSKSFETEENVLQVSDCEMRETSTATTTQKTEQQILVETFQENIRMETGSTENETSNKSDNGCIDDEETLDEKKKISLLGDLFVTSERSDSAEREEHESPGIHPDIVKNVDGPVPTRQRKGRPRPSHKQRSRSGSPGGATEDFSQTEGRPSPSVRDEEAV